MKNKSILLFVIIILAAVSIKTVQAARAPKKGADEEKPSQSAAKEENKEATVLVEAPNPALAARREAEKNAKGALASREWPIKISQVGGKKPKSDTDILIFTPEGRVSSKNYSAKGYPASNVTVTLQSGRSTIVWETMQTNPEAGVLFWRGELDNGFMSGSLTLQNQKEAIEEYAFVSAPIEAKIEVKEEANLGAPQPAVVSDTKEKKDEVKAVKTKAKTKKK